jgi:hypothetical protein
VKKATATAIPGLWADLDYADEVHAKSDHLPPHEDAVLGLLDSLPHRPTVIVHSGHGLQAWWLFEEVWGFDDDAERDRAQRLTKGWIRYLGERAAENGWVIDSVFDLARVMRVPGTVNAKGRGEVLARILSDNGPRYNPSDFDEWIADNADDVTASVDIGEFTIDANASPPFQKFTAAIQNDEKFEATWNRKRADFKDTSGSAYDLSLATQAATYGWSDQDIVDLMIAQRRENGDKPKLREDYFKRTLVKARAELQKVEALEELEELNAVHLERVHDAPTGAVEKDLPAEEREDYFRKINKVLIGGVQIKEAIKYHAEPRAVYQIKTTHGELHDLYIADLLSSSKFFMRIADATGKINVPVAAKEWRPCAQAILNACRKIKLQGMADGDEMIFLLEGYLGRHRPAVYTADNEEARAMANAINKRTPMIKDEHLHVSLQGFMAWIHVAPEIKMHATAKNLGIRLHKLGAKNASISVRYGGKNKQGRYWILPREKFDPLEFVDANEVNG